MHNPALPRYVNKASPFTPYLDEDLRKRRYSMYTISESPSRYEDLVNILPKTRYVHIESPSRHIKNEDSAQRGAPHLKVFGHPQLLTRKVVYIYIYILLEHSPVALYIHTHIYRSIYIYNFACK